MDRFVELGRWMDCYGALLTARQFAIMSQYAYENCSLSEIAERENISRQGVRDILVRAEQQLEQYEKRLHYADRLICMQRELEQCRLKVAKAVMQDWDREQLMHGLDRVEQIWEEDDGI